jgi:hypothetical protein
LQGPKPNSATSIDDLDHLGTLYDTAIARQAPAIVTVKFEVRCCDLIGQVAYKIATMRLCISASRSIPLGFFLLG